MSYQLQNLRHALRIARKKLSRRWLHWRMRHRPRDEVLKAERRLRGEEQLQRLQAADVAVVSFGKSGRTWLRVMLSRLLQEKYDLPRTDLLLFDSAHKINPALPQIFFTHDNYIRDFTGEPDSKRPFYHTPVVLMARDPRDVAVSQFFQWKFRLKPGKAELNGYPEPGSDTDLFEFVTGGNSGGSLQAVVEYLNLWAAESTKLERFFLLRYEDLRADPQGELTRLLAFLQLEATPDQVAAAVEHASFENMKKIEGSQKLVSGGRMAPRDRSNPDSYKVRRAKVGGYRDYFSDEQAAIIDRLLEESLDPLYGY
jgi:alcohol sulfotransferase